MHVERLEVSSARKLASVCKVEKQHVMVTPSAHVHTLVYVPLWTHFHTYINFEINFEINEVFIFMRENEVFISLGVTQFA